MLGVDISERAIQYAKENATSRGVDVRFMAIHIVDLHKLKEKFDFVLEWGILHHIMPPQRKHYVEHVANLLNRDGKCLSMCFNEQSPEFGGPEQKYRKGISGIKLYYSSQSELKELFEPHFHIIIVEQQKNLDMFVVPLYAKPENYVMFIFWFHYNAKLINIPGAKGPDHIGNYFFMEKL